MRPLLLVALLSAQAACTLAFRTDDADRPSTGADVDTYFSTFYDAAIAARADCSGTTLDHARTLWLGPKASLIARAQALFATGKVRLDRELGRACLAAVEGAAPHCTALDATLLDPSGSCGRAFAGILNDGAECASDSECRPGSFCDLGGGACPGHCAPYRTADALCGATAPCGYGLVCSCGFGTPPCDTPTCRPSPLGEGAGCTDTGGAPCGPGLFCHPIDWVCTPLLAGGAACGSSQCRPELWCDAGTCASRNPVGYGCTPGPRMCVQSAWCDDVTTPADPSCRSFETSGSCGPQGSGEYKGCLDADCVGGSCVPRVSYGEACVVGERCAPLSTPASCNAGGLCGEVCGPG